MPHDGKTMELSAVRTELCTFPTFSSSSFGKRVDIALVGLDSGAQRGRNNLLEPDNIDFHAFQAS